MIGAMRGVLGVLDRFILSLRRLCGFHPRFNGLLRWVWVVVPGRHGFLSLG